MAAGYARAAGAWAQSALKAINRGTSIVVVRRLIQYGMVLGIQENLGVCRSPYPRYPQFLCKEYSDRNTEKSLHSYMEKAWRKCGWDFFRQ